MAMILITSDSAVLPAGPTRSLSCYACRVVERAPKTGRVQRQRSPTRGMMAGDPEIERAPKTPCRRFGAAAAIDPAHQGCSFSPRCRYDRRMSSDKPCSSSRKLDISSCSTR